MLFKLIKMQTMVLFRRKSTVIVFFTILALVLQNFFTNMNIYRGEDVNMMIHPMRLLFLNGLIERWNTFFFQYYPLFVITPVAFTFLNDKNSREIIFIQGRTGKKNYYIGMFTSCFICTFLIYTIPFIVDGVLNCIAFPLQSSGDIGVGGFFTPQYIKNINGYLLIDLWNTNSYLYSFLNIIGIGIISGLFSTFALAFSTIPFVKFKILVFLPVYSLLYLIAPAKKLFSFKFSTSYYDYIQMFNTNKKSFIALLAFCGTLFLINIIILFINIRKDDIV